MSDLHQILRNTNPVPAGVPVPDAVRQELFAEVRRTAARHPVRRGRRRWRLPIPMIAVPLLISASVPTGAGVYWGVSQATKDQSTALTKAPAVGPNEGERLPLGERVAAEAAEIMAQTPYPPGRIDRVDWAALSNSWAGFSDGETRGLITELVQARALCFWSDYALDALAAGRKADLADAAEIFRQANRWSALRDRGDDPRRIYLGAAAAARAGEGAGILRLYRFYTCWEVL